MPRRPSLSHSPRSCLLAVTLFGLACEPIPDGVPPDGDPPVDEVEQGEITLAFADEAEARGVDILLDDPTELVDRSPEGSGGRMVVRDLDADGDEDLLFVRSLSEPLVYQNDGSGDFTEVDCGFALDPDDGPFVSIAAADFDDDGLPELLILTRSRLYRAAGLGGLRWGTPELVFEAVAEPKREFAHAAFGDVDADGDLDVLLPMDDSEGTNPWLLINDGDGFRAPLAVEIPTRRSLLVGAITDSDRDGVAELLLLGVGPAGSDAL